MLHYVIIWDADKTKRRLDNGHLAGLVLFFTNHIARNTFLLQNSAAEIIKNRALKEQDKAAARNGHDFIK